MAGPPVERQLPLPIPVQEGEVSTRFAEVIVRNRTEGIDRVGVYSDGALSVAWGEKGELSVHHHPDIWSVMRQNRRVINRFLGVPISESEREEAKADPELEITLPQLHTHLMTTGEIERAQNLAMQIGEVIGMANDPSMSAKQMQRELLHLRDQLGPHVRNEFKVATRKNLGEATASETPGEMSIVALEAMESQLLRAHQGTSIVRSLYTRASDILTWVDEREERIRILKNGLKQALEEIKERRVGQVQLDAWRLMLFSEAGNRLDPVLAITANPYASLVQRNEIRSLKNVDGVIDARDAVVVESIFEPAYELLQQAMISRDVREEGGEWRRFRSPSQQRGRR